MLVEEYTNMRSQIAFCIAKLRLNETLTLAGLGFNLAKVIMMAEILKERIGWLHQVSNFTTKKTPQMEGDSRRPRKEVGMVITLSKMPLDQKLVGYQKPKAPMNLGGGKHFALSLVLGGPRSSEGNPRGGFRNGNGRNYQSDSNNREGPQWGQGQYDQQRDPRRGPY